MPDRKAMPPAAPPALAEPPKLSVSFFGFKIEGAGAAGARFAFWIALAVCGLAALNLLSHLA
ncbi:hypothetical protein [Caulobacter segnis]|uniref:hypothetical protein n=1 Tax=Caulobacter segnis TaxID=88688 RepID=UPI0026AF29AD|nr:hypothetical protein [Caulobacter segnis]